MEKLTPKQRNELRDHFDKYDLDGNGHISVNEIHKLMCALGQNPTKAKVRKIIAQVDENGNGTLDFTEFCAMMQKNMPNPMVEREKLEEAFDLLDKDKNGYITEPELRAVLTSVGEKLTHAQLDQMIKDADLDKDGRIDKREFVNVILGDRSVITGQ